MSAERQGGALVIGASLTGIAAARVLADHFARVTVGNVPSVIAPGVLKAV